MGEENFDASLICVATWDETDGFREDGVVQVAEQLATAASKYELISIESTVSVGTAGKVVRPIFDRAGWNVGKDIFIVTSPERVDLTMDWELRDIPKLVGGVTPGCTARGLEVYRTMGMHVVPVENSAIAEAAKLMENAFRLVNISFANEMADILEASDIHAESVIAAAASKPFGFLPFLPSAGAGGPCVPAAGRAIEALARSVKTAVPTIAAANRSNQNSPGRVLARLKDRGLQRGSSLLVMGATYKSYTSALTESPGIRLANHLAEQGYAVTLTDPHEVPKDLLLPGVRYCAPAVIKGTFAAVCISAWHDEFLNLASVLESSIVLDYVSSALKVKRPARLAAVSVP